MGINTAISLIQGDKNDTHLIFIFDKPEIKTLIDLILLKAKPNHNNKVYILQEDACKAFKTLLKVKKLLCFSIVKCSFNEQVVNEIQKNFENFNNCSDLIPVYENDVKEVIIQK